jgi:hypothetical protein
MDSSRPLVPAFIKKIDRKLLLNSPSVWSARTHLVLFFGLLFAALLTLFCVLVFKDVRQESSVEIISGFVALICFIGFVFWLIYLLRFNVFKRYGNWINGDGVRSFTLFFINILIMVAIPFIPSGVETYMANKQFASAEMVKNVNELNINLNKICYNKLPLKFKQTIVTGVVGRYELNESDHSNDTSLIWRSGYDDNLVAAVDAVKSGATEAVDDVIEEDENTNYVNKTYINIKDFTFEKQKADSIKMLNDTTFISYEYPDYVYARGYNFNDTDDKAVLGSKEIYNIAIKDYTKNNIDSLVKNVKTIVAKYVLKDKYDYNRYTDVEKETYYEFIRRTYNINNFNNATGDILRKKYMWDKDWKIFFRLMYYFTLAISLLVFIFRHSTIKTFFLTALFAVVLAIATALFISLFHFNGSHLLGAMLFYYCIFAALGLSTKMSNKRNLIKGIGLNLFLFALPILPLIMTGFYFEVTDGYRYNYDGNRTYLDKEIYYFYAEVIGFLLLIILLEPLFKKLYRAWYAAAEE